MYRGTDRPMVQPCASTTGSNERGAGGLAHHRMAAGVRPKDHPPASRGTGRRRYTRAIGELIASGRPARRTPSRSEEGGRMDETPTAELPEHVLRNREAWDLWSPEWVEPGPPELVRGALVGDLRHPGERAPCPARRRRPRHDRARLRDGLCLGMARETRRPAGRDRQLVRPARDGADPPAGVRDRVPAHPRQRRDGAVARRELRPGDLGVRRHPVGRSGALGPRGRTPPAAGWAPRRA